MPSCSPNLFFLIATSATIRWTPRAMPVVLLLASFCSSAVGQIDRQAYLKQKPLAEVGVQSLTAPPKQEYTNRNVLMTQPEEEDPLSFYVRTQDGEWSIPTQVNSSDPWVRLLILSPARPSIVDVAIDINQQPFRAAREHWIDKLLAEAKAAFLVRTGAAAADAAGITDETEADSEVKVDTKGTSEAIAASEGADDATAEDEPEIPMVSAQMRKTRTLFQRLINYLAADQSTADREEVRWLLAEWTGGPALLNLSPAFAWRRADAAPLWNALDRDDDQMLSREEMQQTAATFKKADINRDDIVDLNELQRLGKENASINRTKGHPLAVVIDEHTDWNALQKHLRNAYPQQGQTSSEMPLLDRLSRGDRSLSIADLANLLSLSPDVVYRVSFANKAAKVVLLATGNAQDRGESAESWRINSSADQVITIERQEAYIELSAAQGKVDPENASGDMQQTQVAVGAIVDGYPLFRLLDLDNNKQLTRREQQKVEGFLLTLDRNQDDQIDRSEVPTAIRLAVTHGLKIHEHLAQPVAARRGQTDSAVSEAPAWFVGMDRNGDGDLSRREFQGSPAQFAKFDRDGDGLIGHREVQETKTQETKAQGDSSQ